MPRPPGAVQSHGLSAAPRGGQGSASLRFFGLRLHTVGGQVSEVPSLAPNLGTQSCVL